MKFSECVAAIPTHNDLKRTASAHVVDYTRLNSDELQSSILKTAKQYTHPDAIIGALHEALWQDSNLDKRVLSEIIIVDILINESGFMLSVPDLDEQVSQFEQAVVNQSSERKLRDLAGGREGTERFEALSLYNFVLETAWQHRDTKSVDETNLLRKLRDRLRITTREHRLLEAMLGKYPKPHNELHSRNEITDALRSLQAAGLLLVIRDDSGTNFAVIPDEIAEQIRASLGIEIRAYGYRQLLQAKYVRKKAYLQSALDKSEVLYANETVAELQEKVMESMPPSVLLGGLSARDGLNNEDLHAWCTELDLPVAGTKAQRIERIIEFYDKLEQLSEIGEEDPRRIWYLFLDELSRRDAKSLRAQQVIEKDLEIEHFFEAATGFLFENRLNHVPLKQAGTEHSDGLLAFRDTYIMWDNKSKETAVDLNDHIKQFDRYMEKAEKPVPVFMVIAPDFTPNSESVALAYTAEHIGRNICLITAAELKELAELWASDDNKRNSEPFPLGMFARAGRFSLDVVRASFG